VLRLSVAFFTTDFLEESLAWQLLKKYDNLDSSLRENRLFAPPRSFATKRRM